MEHARQRAGHAGAYFGGPLADARSARRCALAQLYLHLPGSVYWMRGGVLRAADAALFERIALRSDLLLSHLPSAYERFFAGALPYSDRSLSLPSRGIVVCNTLE